MDDVLIVGGGVIGLSLAYELSAAGLRVRVVDQAALGQESSWAGAGILPPARRRPGAAPLRQLAALSAELHPAWSLRLLEETGLDNGFRRCGGLYLARDSHERDELAFIAAGWREEGIEARELSADELSACEPALRPATRTSAAQENLSAYFLPEEAQLRNPRHVKALIQACTRRGVTLDPGQAVDDFEIRGRRVLGARTTSGTLTAGHVVIASGAWSGRLAQRLGLRPAIRPIRGQIALLQTGRPLLQHILNQGHRYLVPRSDGRLLIGSTEEDVGFVKQTTAGSIQDLLAFGLALVPELAGAPLERCWSGLRPWAPDGLPYLGRFPDFENAWLAAGHFRAGLELSPATAVTLSQALRGETPEVPLEGFRLDREARTNSGSEKRPEISTTTGPFRP